jgi:hypothetical protein
MNRTDSDLLAAEAPHCFSINSGQFNILRLNAGINLLIMSYFYVNKRFLKVIITSVLAFGFGFVSLAQGTVVHVSLLPPGIHQPKEISSPLAVWSETYETPRLEVVCFLKIRLKDPRVEVFVKLSEDPDGPDGPAEASLTTPDSLMKDKSIIALVNANAFAGIPSIPDPEGKKGWYAGRMVNIAGMAVEGGVQRSPDQPDRLPFWMDSKGRPHIGHPSSKDKVVQAVADWMSPLLIKGKDFTQIQKTGSSKVSDQPVHPRSILGFDRKRRWLLLAVVDGRQPGYSMGMSLGEEAALMKEKGCAYAINLDGGGSSIMLIRDKDGKLMTVNRPSDKSHRPVPVMIGVRHRNPLPVR